MADDLRSRLEWTGRRVATLLVRNTVRDHGLCFLFLKPVTCLALHALVVVVGSTLSVVSCESIVEKKKEALI